jgi:hypothetical protein
VGTSVEERTRIVRDPSAVEAARVAIWRLFEEGYVDEDMATAGLLAVDVGTRRRQQRANGRIEQAAGRNGHSTPEYRARSARLSLHSR